MSHHATNWAITQKGLTPAAKIVLWHLADCHNPHYGCFPSQQKLANDCEMSRRSVNNHLDTLEERGLIRRCRRFDRETGKQLSTRYYLACEDNFGGPESPCEEFAHGLDLHMESVCKSESGPCANSGSSRVQNLHTNPVRGTGNITCKPPIAPQGGGEKESDVSPKSLRPRDVVSPEHRRRPKRDQSRLKVTRNLPVMEELGSWFNRKPQTLWTVAEAMALDDLWKISRQEYLALRSVYAGSTPKTREEKYLFRDLITLLNNWQKALDRAGYAEAPDTQGKPSIDDIIRSNRPPIPREDFIRIRMAEIKRGSSRDDEHCRELAESDRWETLSTPLRKSVVAIAQQEGIL